MKGEFSGSKRQERKNKNFIFLIKMEGIMSRLISITVKFNNNKSKTFGIYNPINAEYKESMLSYEDMIASLEQAKVYCKDKVVKKIIVTNQIKRRLLL